MFQAYVFDAYGTLFDVHSVIDAVEREYPGQGATLSRLWRAKQLEYTWLRSLFGQYRDFWEVTRSALEFACAVLGLACPQVVQDRLMDEYLRLALFPDVIPALDELQGKKLAILSNGSPHMLAQVVASTGLVGRFSAILSVDEVGIYKPSPRVYELASTRLGIPKDRIAFVSANYFDVAGAKAYGFYVYWLNRSGAPADELGLKADKEISNLRDLVI